MVVQKRTVISEAECSTLMTKTRAKDDRVERHCFFDHDFEGRRNGE